MNDIINNLLDNLQKLKSKHGHQQLNGLYVDGTTYDSIHMETGDIHGRKLITLSCGCCSDYEDVNYHISDLSELTQLEIITQLFRD